MTLGQSVENQVQYIIDNEILNPPYISCHTIHQVMRGSGFHWKSADQKTAAGLLKHAGIGQPPNWYLAEQGRKFGYIMDWPPVAIRDVITSTMRASFINPLLDGNLDVPYIIGWCKGYINEENGEAKYIPEQGRFISCYFIMRKERELRPKIHEYILDQKWWFRKQWKMMLEKLPDMVKGQKRLADKTHSRAVALENMWNIDGNISLLENELDPQIPEDMIDWRTIDTVED